MGQGSGITFVRAAAVLLAASALAGPAIAQGASGAAQHRVSFGTWGVDLSARDTSVKPGDDFQRYASGEWLDAHPIPADQSSNGTCYDTYNRNQEQLQDDHRRARPSDSQLGGFYASFMDEARLEQLDDKPLQADLKRVAAIKTRTRSTRFMGETPADFGATLFGAGVGPDPVNPEINTLFLSSGGLGLPDRDYYLRRQFKPQLDAYRAYVERTLTMIGYAGRRRRTPTRSSRSRPRSPR